jgi:hypothetical protein
LITQFIDPGTPEYEFYTIKITDIVYGDTNTVALPGAEFIVDSGTTVLYVNTSQAIDHNSQFDPPAYGHDETGVLLVNCTAIPPPFEVTIAGETFPTNPFDLTSDEGDDICVSGIQDAGDPPGAPSILGDVFLKNVITVFDWGELEIHFSGREYYES